MEVRSFENPQPERLGVRREDAPPPFQNKAFVHDLSVDNTQPTKVFRATYHLPFDHFIFLLIIRRIPEKTTSMFIKVRVRTVRQAVETYEEHSQGGKTRIDETNPTSRRVVAPPPGHNSVTNLDNREGKVLRKQFEGRDR